MANPPAQGNGQQPQQQQPSLLSTIVRMMFFWWIMSFMRGNQPAGPKKVCLNKFDRGEAVDVSIYISESHLIESDLFESEPHWQVEGLALATNDAIAKNITYELPESVQNNGSAFLHAFFVRQGFEVNPYEPGFDRDCLFHRVLPLNKYLPRRKVAKGVNLLAWDEEQDPEGGEQDAQETEAEKIEQVEENEGESANVTEIISFWKPHVTIGVVDDFSKYSNLSIPPHLQNLMVFDAEQNYFPMIYFNEFWLLRDELVPLNDTLKSVNLEVTVTTIKGWLLQLYTQMDQSFDMQMKMGLADERDPDEFKRILTDGNPVLLGITFVVTMLHSLFDFLAFKNDIGFWKDNKSMEGLSARSILINAGCQLVIFLYLMDNETSFVVLLSSGVGMLIEFWKVTKAMHVQVVWMGSIPMLKFQDRDTYNTSNTKKHDEKAMEYLSYVMYPLVGGYAIYTLIYEKHKSWYSWILSSLVGAVYMFGFILMCPQLYLNYKLKSVAHLPWRQLTYKFLNTIIDDLFAFVIKMPILHRLSVFRDDLVFLVFLYQWWIYGVDKSRVNEFGFTSEKPETESAPATSESAIENVGEEVQEVPGKDDEKEGESVRQRKGKGEGSDPKDQPEIQEESEDKKEQ